MRLLPVSLSLLLGATACVPTLPTGSDARGNQDSDSGTQSQADTGMMQNQMDAGMQADSSVTPDSGQQTMSDSGTMMTPDSGTMMNWPPAAPRPPMGTALNGPTFRTGWQNPHTLPDSINTVGWEDSSFISADGTTLYFGYSRLDFSVLVFEGRLEVQGPERPGHRGIEFDIYTGTINGNQWQVENLAVNANDMNFPEAAQGVDRNQETMAYIRFTDGIGDVYIARKNGGQWMPGQAIQGGVNTNCSEDNPTLSADGNTLWFDSDYEAGGCRGKDRRRLFVSRYQNGNWSAPELVPGGPNTTDQRWQPFVTDDGQWFYWNGEASDCPADACIYRAPKSGNGWGNREVVVVPSGDVVGLGEVSITADGKYFYFTYVSSEGPMRIQLNIGVAEAR